MTKNELNLDELVKKDFKPRLKHFIVPLIGEILFEEDYMPLINCLMERPELSLIEKYSLADKINAKRLNVGLVNLAVTFTELVSYIGVVIYNSDKILQFGDNFNQYFLQFIK